VRDETEKRIAADQGEKLRRLQDKFFDSIIGENVKSLP